MTSTEPKKDRKKPRTQANRVKVPSPGTVAADFELERQKLAREVQTG